MTEKRDLRSSERTKKDLKDKPDNWYWGKSDVYNWEPQWDFDCYKLWSFLCAYYYDFDADKSAIQVRNRNMIDRADLVVCCIQHKSGGAYRTIQYAEKQGKKIVNLADEK